MENSTNDIEFRDSEIHLLENPDPQALITLTSESAADPNTIIFSIEDEEYLKISSEGFFVKGRLIEEDREIYQEFKNWLNKAMNP